MAINPPEGTRYDTRGLPEGYDPHMFYEYRRDTLVTTATGIESFAYKYIPWSIMKSFAFAIDPLYPFKVAPHRITPFNRNRKRSVASVLQQRFITTTTFNYGYSQKPNFGGISVCWSPGLDVYSEFHNSITNATISQPPLVDSFDDTTSRTRLMGSEQGTMRRFTSYVNSPPRRLRQSEKYQYIYHPAAGIPSVSCVNAGGTGNNSSHSEDSRTFEVAPSAAVLFPNDLNSLRDAEYAQCDQAIAKYVLPMFKEWSPNKRDHTLFRNLVELRDVERSIVSLQDTVIKFRQLYVSLAKSPSLRDIIFNIRRAADTVPSEYLSYHFGWKQLYKDMMDLLALPEKMSRKYDFLIRRAGKPTTFRTKRNVSSGTVTGVPSFSYTSSALEYGVITASRVEREIELRLVINATFDFPPPNGVSFRSHSFLDRIGLVPRPTDIYNLIPWTWLIDWFTGFGNYVEVIDNLARDNTLVNWGMITASTKGKLITNRSSKTDNKFSVIEDFVGTTTSISTVSNNHTSFLNFECSVRKDAAQALSVKTTCMPDLTAYQSSILGAILAQRKSILSSKAFRPRS